MIHTTLDERRSWVSPRDAGMKDVDECPPPRIDITRLMAPLELRASNHRETRIPAGYRCDLSSKVGLQLHFIKAGLGWLSPGARPCVPVFQNSLVIAPPDSPATLRAASLHGERQASSPTALGFGPSGVPRVDASTPDGLIVFSVVVAASYGNEVGLFDSLREPLVERFEPSSPLEIAILEVQEELTRRHCGMTAMIDAMLRQILVQVLRRSMINGRIWSERFSAFSDRRIAQAFVDMANSPGANHSTTRMADDAGLSRSFFMRRFHEAFGVSPGAVLRQLRMRRAVVLLRGGQLSVGRISEEVGYASRSSFLRAFRQTYGCEPSDYDDGRLENGRSPQVRIPANPREDQPRSQPAASRKAELQLGA
jgi:AraC family transcriptional regulator, activator of mtrCDE